MIYQNSQEIEKDIIIHQEKIENLKIEQVKVARQEKQYKLLTSSALQSFIQLNVSQMEDFMIADKCRETSLHELLSIMARVLNIGIQWPVELLGKTVADVLYILDHIENDNKLDDLEIPKEDLSRIN